LIYTSKIKNFNLKGGLNMIRFRKVQKLISIIPFLLLCSSALAQDDSEITHQVESKIYNNEATSKSDIKVKTNKGIVTLKGNVNSENEAYIAVEEAYSVPDVKDVDTTNLKVAKGKDKSEHPYKDAYITAKVKGYFVREKLFGDKSIDVSGVNVETKNGVVYLTGTVDTQAQINTSISLAKKIKGVKDVKSTVTVQNSR
jgi:hyperosmotically inducible protein